MAATYLHHLPATFAFGSQGQDGLVSQRGTVAVGLAGDDRLDAQGEIGVLQGGYGNDVYTAGAAYSEIADAGGYDQLQLSGSFTDYSAGLVGHRHLLLSNQQTGDNILVLDWRGQGRVESFVDADGQQLHEGQVEQMLFASQHGHGGYGHYGPGGLAPGEGMTGLGNIPTTQAMDMLGIQELSPVQFLSQLSINAKLAQLDMHEVAGQLSGAADDNAAIGQAFADAMQHHLSPMEQQVWNELNYEEQLAQSDYQGLDFASFVDQNEQDEGNADNGAENGVEGNADGDNDDGVQSGGDHQIIDEETAQTLSDLFQTVLDRPLHDAEHSQWAYELADGEDMEDIADDFLDFDEYEARFETEDDQLFVSQSFDHLLNRAPTEDELNYWTDQLDSNDREEVLVDFVTAAQDSPELVGVAPNADIAIA